MRQGRGRGLIGFTLVAGLAATIATGHAAPPARTIEAQQQMGEG